MKKKIVKDMKRTVRNGLAHLRIIDPFRGVFKDVEFETTAYCNRKCVYCPQNVTPRTGNEEGRYMPEIIFKKLIGDLKAIKFSGCIAPHLYGEPMSDPRLPDWVKYIRSQLPRCTIKVVTNGDYLDKESYQKLITAGVDFFYLSKHSADLKRDTIHLLEGLSEDEKAKRIIIFDYYRDYREKQGLLNSRGGEVDLKKEKHHPECCIYVAYPVIDTFGNVILCCNDYHSKYVSGNIMEKGLMDIWRDPKNIRLRRRIYKGKMDLPICQNCWI